MNPTETDGGRQEPHKPHNSPPKHTSSVLVSCVSWLEVVQTTECPHPPRSVPSNDVGVVSREIEWVHKEHSHKEDTH